MQGFQLLAQGRVLGCKFDACAMQPQPQQLDMNRCHISQCLIHLHPTIGADWFCVDAIAMQRGLMQANCFASEAPQFCGLVQYLKYLTYRTMYPRYLLEAPRLISYLILIRDIDKIRTTRGLPGTR